MMIIQNIVDKNWLQEYELEFLSSEVFTKLSETLKLPNAKLITLEIITNLLFNISEIPQEIMTLIVEKGIFMTAIENIYLPKETDNDRLKEWELSIVLLFNLTIINSWFTDQIWENLFDNNNLGNYWKMINERCLTDMLIQNNDFMNKLSAFLKSISDNFHIKFINDIDYLWEIFEYSLFSDDEVVILNTLWCLYNLYSKIENIDQISSCAHLYPNERIIERIWFLASHSLLEFNVAGVQTVNSLMVKQNLKNPELLNVIKGAKSLLRQGKKNKILALTSMRNLAILFGIEKLLEEGVLFRIMLEISNSMDIKVALEALETLTCFISLCAKDQLEDMISDGLLDSVFLKCKNQSNPDLLQKYMTLLFQIFSREKWGKYFN